MTTGDSPDFYIVKNRSSIEGLPGWLMQRPYNTVRHGDDFTDRNGKHLISLKNGVKRCGLILVVERTLLERAVEITGQLAMNEGVF